MASGLGSLSNGSSSYIYHKQIQELKNGFGIFSTIRKYDSILVFCTTTRFHSKCEIILQSLLILEYDFLFLVNTNSTFLKRRLQAIGCKLAFQQDQSCHDEERPNKTQFPNLLWPFRKFRLQSKFMLLEGWYPIHALYLQGENC